MGTGRRHEGDVLNAIYNVPGLRLRGLTSPHNFVYDQAVRYISQLLYLKDLQGRPEFGLKLDIEIIGHLGIVNELYADRAIIVLLKLANGGLERSGEGLVHVVLEPPDGSAWKVRVDRGRTHEAK